MSDFPPSVDPSGDDLRWPRRPLEAAVVAEELAALGVAFDVRILAECDSTNAVAAAWAPPTGAESDRVRLVAADRQTAGRGRLDRVWTSPSGAGLLFSLRFELPEAEPLPTTSIGLLPLVAGAAVAQVCRGTGVPAGVKWPNDVVVEADSGLRKLGGLLAEVVPGGPAPGTVGSGAAVVVGVGVNVGLTGAEAPTAEATSLLLEGARPESRERLLARCAAAIATGWRELGEGGAADLLDQYRAMCLTLGRRVRVQLPGRADLVGEAVGVDPHGHLLVAGGLGPVEVVTAGDVVHVRPAPADGPLP